MSEQDEEGRLAAVSASIPTVAQELGVGHLRGRKRTKVRFQFPDEQKYVTVATEIAYLLYITSAQGMIVSLTVAA